MTGQVAREMQDLSVAVSEVGDAIREVAAKSAEQAPMLNLQVPAPVFQVPAVAPPDVVVNVAAADQPEVNVAAPSVTVNNTVEVPAPQQIGYLVEITKRDADGRVAAFVILPILE